MVCLTRTSVGTTSRSRKISERSRAISAKEFCKVKYNDVDGDDDDDDDGDGDDDDDGDGDGDTDGDGDGNQKT